MNHHQWKALGAAAVAALLAVGIEANAGASVADSAPRAPAESLAPLPFPPQSETVFHPISPTRILDTRTNLGGHPGKISSTAPFALQVTGGVVPLGAAAIAFNVTVTAPTRSSWLTLYPTGGLVPTVSNINYSAGQTVANFATVKLSATGQMTIRPGAGSTDVIVDVAGYYSKSTAWGQQGYVGWVQARDTGIVRQHSNNGQAIAFTHGGDGSNTIRFNGANIPAFLTANATIQVSAAGLVPRVCTTLAGMSADDLLVTVTCKNTDDVAVPTEFYLQVAG